QHSARLVPCARERLVLPPPARRPGNGDRPEQAPHPLGEPLRHRPPQPLPPRLEAPLPPLQATAVVRPGLHLLLRLQAPMSRDQVLARRLLNAYTGWPNPELKTLALTLINPPKEE